ncbi:MAG: acetylornithine deacetylase [Pseudomonadota bacterium]
MSSQTALLQNTEALLGNLIAYPTVSEDTNLPLIHDLANRLADLGARVELFHDESGEKANLFATLGPDIDGGIVLSGHSDVVPVADQDWASDPFKMEERDERLYGRGSCDMKGFIAACMAMAPEFARLELKRPLHFAFTYDEETGCFGAKALAKILAKKETRPSVALIGEPTMMKVIDGHKGCHEYTTHFNGLAGHGSAPAKGVNAVEYAARYVARLMHLQHELRARAPEDSRFEPPWSTINVGGLQGGVAHNVIPSTAQVEWDFRPVQPSDQSFVKNDLQRYCDEELLPSMQSVFADASISTEVIGEVEGLMPAEPSEAREIVMALTGANSTGTVAFGTEAGIFQQLGMSAVVCGPGSIDQAHKADEFVERDQLAQCLKMLSGLKAIVS